MRTILVAHNKLLSEATELKEIKQIKTIGNPFFLHCQAMDTARQKQWCVWQKKQNHQCCKYVIKMVEMLWQNLYMPIDISLN